MISVVEHTVSLKYPLVLALNANNISNNISNIAVIRAFP